MQNGNFYLILSHILTFMESFFRTHAYLVRHVKSPVKRLLTNDIDWTQRLIGIKGTRGVGKTTFLLQYAKDNYSPEDRRCLYVNFNHFYFTTHTLSEFARNFYEKGGKTLLLDQIFKYENWSEELRICYDSLPGLQIIFTGSSVMRLIEENENLKEIVKVYNLRGFSFREFLNLQTGKEFRHYSLDEILTNHLNIASEISSEINPGDYFADYLHHGFYPFFLETINYSENLLKTINMMIEVDVLLIKQIDLKYLSRIRKLLYLIIQCVPCQVNISQLSEEIQTSRSTVMNYLKYLTDARLLNMLYQRDDKYPKKPRWVYPHNTNVLHVLSDVVDKEVEMKTYLFNTLHSRHEVNCGSKHLDFVVNNEVGLCYLGEKTKMRQGNGTYYVSDALMSDQEMVIPAWIFGFLY